MTRKLPFRALLPGVPLILAVATSPLRGNPTYTEVGSCEVWKTLASLSAHLSIADTLCVTSVEYVFRGLVPFTAYDVDLEFLPDSCVWGPEMLSADVQFGAGAASPLSVDTAGPAWRFTLFPKPASGQSCRVHVRYRQKLACRQAGLVLTTCRPAATIEYCVLEVSFQGGDHDPRFSMPFERVGDRRWSQEYEVVRTRWKPKKDLVVSW